MATNEQSPDRSESPTLVPGLAHPTIVPTNFETHGTDDEDDHSDSN